MRDFSNVEIYNGLLTNDEKVLEYLIKPVYLQIKEAVSLWIKGEILVIKFTNKFILRRVKNLKGSLLTDNIKQDEISAPFVRNYLSEKKFKYLFRVDDVYKYLQNLALNYVRKNYWLIHPDRDAVIEDICITSLAGFHVGYVKNFPDDPDKCKLNLLYTIMHNKICDVVGKEIPKVEDSELDEELTPADNYSMGINQENKNNLLLETFRDIFNEDQIIEIEDITEDQIKDIVKIAEENVLCFKKHLVSQNCVRILLFSYFGFRHSDIRDIVRNSEDEKYDENSFKATLYRCRRKIKEYCKE